MIKRWLFTCLALLCGVGLLSASPSQEEEGEGALIVESGAMRLTFSGYAQASYICDGNYLYNSGNINDYHYGGRSNTFTVDRLILMANAQVVDRVRMFVMLDARSMSLFEMYGEYEFSKAFKLRLGLYKQPFMLENIISPTRLNNLQINPVARFMSGMSLDDAIGKTAGRDIGLMATGELPSRGGRNLISYSVGLFNGNYRGGHNSGFKDNNRQKDFVGMVNYYPTSELMLTTSWMLGTGHAMVEREGVYAEGQDYRRRRICVGAEWTGKPMHLRSEYVYGIDNHTPSRGVYVSADVHLTPHIDLVANYDYLDTGNLGADQHSTYLNNRTHTFVAGVAYNIYKQCRVLSEYTYAKPEVGKAGHLWQTQLQVRF